MSSLELAEFVFDSHPFGLVIDGGGIVEGVTALEVKPLLVLLNESELKFAEHKLLLGENELALAENELGIADNELEPVELVFDSHPFV